MEFMASTNFILAYSYFPSLYKMHPPFTTISESSWLAEYYRNNLDVKVLLHVEFNPVNIELAIGVK